MSLKIKRFQLANYKAVKLFDVTPEGDVVLASTENGEGKSSVLDGIDWLVRGNKAAPGEPIRKGAKKARGVGQLCDENGTPVLVIERERTHSGDKLIVREAGSDATISSPQAMLDKLYSLVAFEPLELEQMLRREPRKFADQLRKLTGITTDDLDQQTKDVTEARRVLGRDAKAADERCQKAEEDFGGVSASGSPHPDAPAELVDVLELAGQLEQLAKQARENDRARARKREIELGLQAIERDQKLAAERVTAIDHQIAELQRQRDEVWTAAQDLTAELHQVQDELDNHMDEMRSLTDPAPEEARIRAAIADAGRVNARVRENAAHEAAIKQARASANAAQQLARELNHRYYELTEELECIADAKRARIAAVKMPIDGLTFNDDGSVYYRARPDLPLVPLDQASEGERYRIYAAIAMAQNPQLRVLLLRDAKSLGPASRKLLADVAHEHGWQCWWETLDTTIPGALIIEAGVVKEDEPAPTTERSK